VHESAIGTKRTLLPKSALMRHMKRTSTTHPLRIAAVTAGPEFGRVGITFCPGKYDDYGISAWDRDLAVDLDAIRDWGATAVVTLLEDYELTLLKVPLLGDEVLRRGMLWFHLPIVDASVPDDNFERTWESVGERLRSILRKRSDVLVHCREGIGRAGMIAARLLIELGLEPKGAIAMIREARGALSRHPIRRNTSWTFVRPRKSPSVDGPSLVLLELERPARISGQPKERLDDAVQDKPPSSISRFEALPRLASN
jgi:protein-tyrosine phosphatase